MIKDMKYWKCRIYTILLSMNLDYLVDPEFVPPTKGDKNYEQFVFDSKFLYIVLSEQVMNPDHEAQHALFTNDISMRGDLAYTKLINMYDNETIEKSTLGRLYNRWMSLRFSATTQGALKT